MSTTARQLIDNTTALERFAYGRAIQYLLGHGVESPDDVLTIRRSDGIVTIGPVRNRRLLVDTVPRVEIGTVAISMGFLPPDPAKAKP